MRSVEKSARSVGKISRLFEKTLLVMMIAGICIAAVIGNAIMVDAMLIQEAYPDPVVTDSGGEAVLLYNNADSAVDISGWKLGTPSSESDATIPANTTLTSHRAYLIADSGWSTNKDNASWAEADLEDSITLRNTGGTLTLRDRNGTVVDSVDYPTSEEGSAYWRKGNTMTTTEPLFSAPLDALYLIALDGNKSATGSISLTDNGMAINSITPLPGRTKYVTVTVESANEPTVQFLGTSQAMESLGNDEYSAELGINYTTAPGSYDITVQADSTMTAQLKVEQLLAVESDSATLQLGSGRNISVEGDDAFGTGKPTLRNSGNVPVDVYLARTSVLMNGTKATATVTASAGGEMASITTKAAKLATLAPGATAPLSIALSLPRSAASGNYSTSFVFQLKKA